MENVANSSNSLRYRPLGSHRKGEGPFRPPIRGDADRSPDLLHEAADEAKAVALACGRLDKADAVIPNREKGARGASRQGDADRAGAFREGMNIGVRDDLGDDDAERGH